MQVSNKCYKQKIISIVSLIVAMFSLTLCDVVLADGVGTSQDGYSTAFQKALMYDAPNGGNLQSSGSAASTPAEVLSGNDDEKSDKEKSRTANDAAKKNLDDAHYQKLDESKLTTAPLAKSGITNITSQTLYNLNPTAGSPDHKYSIPGNQAFAMWLGSMSHYGYLRSSMGGIDSMVNSGNNNVGLKITMPWGLLQFSEGLSKTISDTLAAFSPAAVLLNKTGGVLGHNKRISDAVDAFASTLTASPSAKAFLKDLIPKVMVIIVSIGLVAVIFKVSLQNDVRGATRGLGQLVMKVALMVMSFQVGSLMVGLGNSFINSSAVQNTTAVSQFIFDAESSAKGANFNTGSFPSEYVSKTNGDYYDTRYASNSAGVVSYMNKTAWNSLKKKNAEADVMERYISGATFKADNYLDSLTSATPGQARTQANLAISASDSAAIKNGDKNMIKRELSQRIAGSSLSDDNMNDHAGNYYQANYYNMVNNGQGGSVNQMQDLLIKNDAWKNRLYYTSTWGSNNKDQLSVPSTYYLLNMEIKGNKEAYTLYDNKLQASRQPTFMSATLPANKEGQFSAGLWSSAIIGLAATFYMFQIGFGQVVNAWKYLTLGLFGSWLDMVNFAISWLALNITVAIGRTIPGLMNILISAIRNASGVLTGGNIEKVPMIGSFISWALTLILTLLFVLPIFGKNGAGSWYSTGKKMAAGGVSVAREAGKKLKSKGE